MPTSRDVARLAGVSQSTVSYVLTGKRPISDETRRRVEGAIAELTFQPNAGARALASQRTRVIGLMAPFAVTNDHSGLLPFVETIASGVRAHDHDLLLVTSDEGAAGMSRVVGRRIVDALVVMEVEARDERLEVAAALDVPVILIGVPEDPAGLPCVDMDFEAAAALCVEEVVSSGCASAVVLGYSARTIERDINYVRRFERGARARAEELGTPLRVVAPVEASRSSAAAALDEALGKALGDAGARGGGHVGALPGLVVPHTELVPHVLRALADRGLVPGRDVAVVAVATDATATSWEPAVTNVSLEPRDVSRRAVETLFHLLDPPAVALDVPPPGVELVTPRLTRRSTTRPPDGPASTTA